MHKRTKVLAVLGAIAALGSGAAVAAAGSDDDATEQPITGAALDRATRAALAHVGEGRVTGTEAGDEESAYEVEVTRPDGSQVDVQLDRSFEVVAAEDDAEDDE